MQQDFTIRRRIKSVCHVDAVLRAFECTGRPGPRRTVPAHLLLKGLVNSIGDGSPSKLAFMRSDSLQSDYAAPSQLIVEKLVATTAPNTTGQQHPIHKTGVVHIIQNPASWLAMTIIAKLLSPAFRRRDELLNGKVLYSLKEAQIIIAQRHQRNNTKHPHTTLGHRPPAPETIIPLRQRPIMN